MKKTFFLCLIAVLLLCSCTKQTEETAGKSPHSAQVQTEPFRKSWELKDLPFVITPAGEVSALAQTQDKNHFGEYVDYKGSFYFRQYKKKDYEETAIHQNHGYVEGRKRNMMCYTDKGKLKTLFSDEGVGSFYIFEDRFFAMTRTDTQGEIYSVDMKGENRHVLEKGCILAADEKKGFLICKNEDLGLFSVNLNAVNWAITPLTLNGSFLAIKDGLVYYQESPEGEEAYLGKVYLKRISTDGIGDMILAETKPDLYDDVSAAGKTMIRQFRMTPYNIYFSYGSVGGSAAMYQGGGIMCVPADGIGVRRLTTALVDEHFFVEETGFADYLYFYSFADDVYSRKNLTTEEITATEIVAGPVNQVFMREKELIFLNADTGKTEVVFSKEDLDALELTEDLMLKALTDTPSSDSYIYDFKNTVFSEQYVFTELYRYVPAPEEDIGWRAAYRLISRAVLVKDRTTGEIKVLDIF